jgi:hypothetical protein
VDKELTDNLEVMCEILMGIHAEHGWEDRYDVIAVIDNEAIILRGSGIDVVFEVLFLRVAIGFSAKKRCRIVFIVLFLFSVLRLRRIQNGVSLLLLWCEASM